MKNQPPSQSKTSASIGSLSETRLLKKAFLEELVWLGVAILVSLPFFFSIVFIVFAPAIGFSVYFMIHVVRNFRHRSAQYNDNANMDGIALEPLKNPHYLLFKQASQSLSQVRRKVKTPESAAKIAALQTVLVALKKHTDSDPRIARFLQRDLRRRLPLLTDLAKQYAALCGTGKTKRDETALQKVEQTFEMLTQDFERLLQVDFTRFDFLRMEADAEILIETR